METSGPLPRRLQSPQSGLGGLPTLGHNWAGDARSPTAQPHLSDLRNTWEGSTALQPHSNRALWPHFHSQAETNLPWLPIEQFRPKEEIIPASALIKRNSRETWRTQAACWRYQTEGEGRQLQHQLIRYIFPSTHWHLQTCFCQLVTFSCYLHSRTPPDRSGHSSLLCLSIKARDSAPKFATGLTVAARRMLQCQLWIPALLGQLLVLLSSWERLWPCPLCQGQADLPAPHPGCQHHSSCSAGIHSSRIPVWGKPCTPGDCCSLPARAAVTHTAPIFWFCRLFTLSIIYLAFL